MVKGVSRASVTDRFGVVRILGCDVHRVTAAQVSSLFCEWIDSGDRTARSVVCTGFHGLWVAHQDPAFKRILNGADVFAPDGVATEWMAKLQGEPLLGRARGFDIMQAFFKQAQTRHYRSYFYGDTQETLDNLEQAVGARYPGHMIAGTESPPFRPLTAEESDAAVDRINAAKPDVLWVGLGLPKQERWVAEHIARLRVPVIVAVGACFRFYSGDVRVAPHWIANAGFEWAWRLAAEPRKLWRRDFIDGPRFLAAALPDALRQRARRRADRAHRTN